MLPSDVYMMIGFGEVKERPSLIPPSSKTVVISSHGVTEKFISSEE